MKHITKIIRDLTEAQSRLADLKRLVRQIGETSRWGYRHSDWHLYAHSEDITASIQDFSKLSEVRMFLRSRLGKWNDTQTAMFTNAGGGVTVQWKSPTHKDLIIIQFAADKPEDFPTALLPSNKCRIDTAQSEPYTEMRVVCPVGKTS